ncbi:hypothetical protein B9Z19DRAFT_998311 [Tuber borchii]|uniref:Uncharacterized protein n=1 Tax=Tuber borchii TaxID=42251 RepID=A0A2T6ZH21_TUBBO|nr:hypothetical protein B9Z19DRAFT_998311 [Tuber borchii]
MSKDRCFGRNVHIYSANDTGRVLGGLVVMNGMTNSNFYSMVEITFTLDNDYTLCGESGTIVQRDDNPLKPGKYFISTTGSLVINNEPWLVREGKVFLGIPTKALRDAVRNRDGGCVITGQRSLNPGKRRWGGYSATHILPPEHAKHLVGPGYDSSETPTRKSIYSVQNGLLLRRDMRRLFERYLVSINPDDNYKIVCFMGDDVDISGKHLDKTFLKLEGPQRPGDRFLRWHFRQAVLANMRGQGEPIFECYPSDSDTDEEL